MFFVAKEKRSKKNRDFERCTKANKTNDERLQCSKIFEKFCKNMDVTNIENKFNKALRLLDLEREERALDILNEIIIKAQKEKDALFFIRASCVLGELFFQKGNTEKAQQYLLNVINTPYEKNDVVDYEKAVAASILHQIG